MLLLCLAVAEAKPDKGKGNGQPSGDVVDPAPPPAEPGTNDTSQTSTTDGSANGSSTPAQGATEPSTTISTTDGSAATTEPSTTTVSTTNASSAGQDAPTSPNGSTAAHPVSPGDGTVSTSPPAPAAPTPAPADTDAATSTPGGPDDGAGRATAASAGDGSAGAGVVWLAAGADRVLPAPLQGQPVAQVAAWALGIALVAGAIFSVVRRDWIWDHARHVVVRLAQGPLVIGARIIPLGGQSAIIDAVRAGHHDAAAIAAAHGVTRAKATWSLERMAAKGALAALPGVPRRYCLPHPAAKEHPRAAHAFLSPLGQEIAGRVISDPCLSRAALQAEGLGREVAYIDAIEEMVRAGLLVTINKDGAERVRASDLLARLHVRASSPP